MNKHKCILIAEDDENDLFLLRRGFASAGLTHKLVHVRNGQVALNYLTGKQPFSDRDQNPFPDLLLLDTRMPCVDGFDLLRILQSHPELRALPVVVFSSSLQELERAKGLGARESLIKPTYIDEYRDIVLGLHQRWLGGAPTTAPRDQTDANTSAQL